MLWPGVVCAACFAAALDLRAETAAAPATNAPDSAIVQGTNAVAVPPARRPSGLFGAPISTNSAAEHAPTEIFSESLNLDMKSNIAVYVGHVRVVDPQMKMTCDLMTVHVPKSGQIDNIDAEGAVVIDAVDSDGKPIHATGDRAVYRYRMVDSKPSETIELTGNPRIEKEGGWLTGTVVTWDRINNSFSASGGQHMVIEAPASELNASTNRAVPARK